MWSRTIESLTFQRNTREVNMDRPVNKEFGGIGRTWWMVVGLSAIAGALTFTGAIDAEQYMSYTKFLFFGGAGKSALVGGIDKFKK